MSPTVLRVRGYRFYFFSREESRPHIHVQHARGEEESGLTHGLNWHGTHGLGVTRVNTALRIIEERENEARAAWVKHFGR
ncbi:MAG: DUF4160 domain-containing protein [Gemmatimonadaceae bacterium]